MYRTGSSTLPLVASLLLPLAIAGCARDFSPNTYSTTAVQQANKVNQGVVIGVRKIDIRGDAATGAATGAAAGGIVGNQVGKGATSALSTLAGTVTGGLIGATAERAAEDTSGYEYIVRRGNGDLLSVTQGDKTPLAIGTKVLLIEGAQARIVPDYTVPYEEPKKEEPKAEAKPAEEKPSDSKSTEAAAPAAPVTSEPLPTEKPVQDEQQQRSAGS